MVVEPLNPLRVHVSFPPAKFFTYKIHSIPHSRIISTSNRSRERKLKIPRDRKMAFLHVIPILCLSLFLLSFPTAQAQIRTPCSASMLSSFAPCVNFINGTGNGTRPTPGCCSSLSSMMSNGTDCLCQIFNGNVPFPVPINRTLAISLPRACNMPGVPLQCRAAGAPTPTPTPGPALSPESPLSPTPGASTTNPEPVSPALTPESDSTPSTPGDSGTPTTGTNAGSRPSVDPSAAERSHILSPTLLLAVLGALALKNY